MADTILTLDCWHPGCDFHELLTGIEVGPRMIFESDTTTWDHHNTTCHPQPRTGRP